MKAGDKIEFLSDKQTERGPSAGFIKLSCGKQILVRHSNVSEEFCVDDLIVERKTEHHKGGTLWVCS